MSFIVTGSVYPPTADTSLPPLQLDVSLGKYYTTIDSSVFQTFSFYIHGNDGAGKKNVSPEIQVSVACSPTSSVISEEGGQSDKQYV